MAFDFAELNEDSEQQQGPAAPSGMGDDASPSRSGINWQPRSRALGRSVSVPVRSSSAARLNTLFPPMFRSDADGPELPKPAWTPPKKSPHLVRRHATSNPQP